MNRSGHPTNCGTLVFCQFGPNQKYAEQKKKNCVGTQSRKRRVAWVRKAEEGDLRGYAEQKRLRCVRTVKVRGAIGSMTAYHQLKCAAR